MISFNTKRGLMAAALLAFMPIGAAAEDFPSQPVTFVVPFPAGGTVDQVARAIAEDLQANWGEAVVVENRPGAGNIVGSTAVAQARPDGHTILLGTTSVAANPALFSSLPYGPDDLAPVIHLAASANVLLVSPELGVSDMEDFIALARDANPPLTYGSVGRGSGHHICMEMFQFDAEAELLHVPYAGVAPALAAFRSGEVPVYCSDVTGALALIRDDLAIPLGITGTARATALPDVPTMVELGLEGMGTAGFIGVMVTGGTPPAVIEQLNADIAAVVNAPELFERMAAIGYDMNTGSADEFAAFIAENAEIYRDVVERAGIEVTD